ncbi:MAG: hypothetical protein ACRETL_06310 [Gammaproteobacteria bacterium]
MLRSNSAALVQNWRLGYRRPRGRPQGIRRPAGTRYTPIPFAQNLEAMHLPDADGVVAKVQKLMAV